MAVDLRVMVRTVAGCAVTMMMCQHVTTAPAALSPSENQRIINVDPGYNTLHLAFAQRRALVGTGPVSINLKPGMHILSRPLRLSAEDGGSEAHAVIINGTGATITGAVNITGWTRKTTLSGTGVVWEASIPSGFDAETLGNRLQMWRGDTRLQCARSPVLTYANANDHSIVYQDTDVRESYHDQANVLLVLYESWTASFNRFANIDTTTKNVTLAVTWSSKWAKTASGSRYYIQNAIEELDEVGEFYVDTVNGKVLLITESSDDPNTGDQTTLASREELLSLAGTAAKPMQNLKWIGTTFTHSSVETGPIMSGESGQSGDFLTTAMIHVNNATGIAFESCSFRATGGYAIWFDYGAFDCSLSASHATDLGGGAVRVGRGHANNLQRECEGHIIENNVLQNGGFVWQEGCGVLAQNVGNTNISHNEIGFFRYTGVSTGWTWGYGPTIVHDVLTSFNHIHHIGQGYLSDMGCVYTLGHQPGSRIENNFCSDVQSWNYGGWAYYADEGSRDEVFRSNIATRTKCGGFHQHYGTDNLISNNIFYDVNIGDVVTPGRSKILMKGTCDAAMRASTHTRNINTCHPDTNPKVNCCCYPGCDQGKCSSFTMKTNIVLLPDTSNSSFVETTFPHGLDNMTFSKNVYFSMATSVSNPHMFNGTESFQEWQKHGKDVDSADTDPQFASLTDYTLKPTSPALAMGFIPIDTSNIGPNQHTVGALHNRAIVTGLASEPLIVAKTAFAV